MSSLKQHTLDLVMSSQTNYLILVLANAKDGQEQNFVVWFKDAFRDQLQRRQRVIRARAFERDPVDVTFGRFPLVPMQYLALVEIGGDGPEDAHNVIDFIQKTFAEQPFAGDVATWLYYPVSEKYGIDRGALPTTIMIHYTNPVVGMEAEYAEWFNTRLLRHAAVFDPLVNAQRFERSQHQNPGALEPTYQTVALYDQAGPSEQLIEAFKNPPPNLPDMVSLDNERFSEASYLPLT